jgi:hypothetical protein
MITRQRLVFVSLVLAFTCFGPNLTARADSVTSNTIVVVQGTIGGGVTDSDFCCGIFTFLIPAGHSITAANLVGSAQYNLPVGAQIGLVLESSLLTNISGVSASTPINIALAPSMFSALADGTAALDLNRFGGTFGGSYNLFSLKLELTTAPAGPAQIPEPATLLLFGSGVFGLASAAWRRRRNILG